MQKQTLYGKSMINILITSASKKIPLIQAVQSSAFKVNPDIKVIAGDSDEYALARYIANEFWKMPDITDEEVDSIICGCKEREIGIIIPTRDGELLFWARYAAKFYQSGIDVIISPESSVKLCFDKLSFSQFGITYGFPFIKSFNHPDKLSFKSYVVKERYGAGSKNIGLDMNRKEALLYSKNLENPIFQPFIPGKEISIDAWANRDHNIKGVVLRNRDRVLNGESQITTTFRDDNLESLVVQILESLSLRGPVVMQAIIDNKGNPHIIECNSRFGGASTASIAAGLDIIYWILLESFGYDVEKYPFERIKGEVKQIRIPCDIYKYDYYF